MRSASACSTAQAASLANQLELARNILLAIPDTPEFLLEVRLRLAELDFRAGQYDRATEAIGKLLTEPALAPDDAHRGRALVLRGNLNFRRSDFAKALTDFDAAVAALDANIAPLDLCDALTRRGLTRVALNDYEGALRTMAAPICWPSNPATVCAWRISRRASASCRSPVTAWNWRCRT